MFTATSIFCIGHPQEVVSLLETRTIHEIEDVIVATIAIDEASVIVVMTVAKDVDATIEAATAVTDAEM